MSGSHLMRWIAFLLCGALSVLGCVGSTDSSQSQSGSLSLSLEVGNIDIDEVDYLITNGGEPQGGTPQGGTIDTSAPGSTPSVEVFGLLPGDYTVRLSATSTDGETTCEGSEDFSIDADELTDVMVYLRCKLPETLGGVRVNGEFNVCAVVKESVVKPLQTSVGHDIDLSAMGEDAEGDNITYIWSGTGGDIDDPNAMDTTYTCEEVGKHSVTITVYDDGFEYCMDSWTTVVTCVEGDGNPCDGVVCKPDGNECTVSECDPSDGMCKDEDVDNGTDCKDGDGMCLDGECVDIDRCEDVNCDDDEECTDDSCNPLTGKCVNDPVDDGTDCAGGEGMCVDGECMAQDLCEGVNCPPTGNQCTVGVCNMQTGDCDEMNVPNDTECDLLGLGDGVCSDGVCVDNNLCAGQECPSDNDCVEDGMCNPDDGECIPGDNAPAGDPCDLLGLGDGVCDGAGSCGACNTPDDCTEAVGQCEVKTCVDNACGVDSAPDMTICDFVGIGDGVCENGDCVEAPECEIPANCDDDNVCTNEDCVLGECVYDPNQGAGCDSDTGSGDGSCDDTGSCVSNDECTLDAQCPDDDGNECTVPVCDQTGAPYVCDEDSAPADGNDCNGGAGTCQGGACVVATPPYVDSGTGDTTHRAGPRFCSAGEFPFIDAPRADCALCLSDSCSGGSNALAACDTDADCPGGNCIEATPGPDDCSLDCFTFVCTNPTDFLFAGGGPGGACVYPTGTSNCPFLGCEVVSNTLKNQLSIDTFLSMDVVSTGLPNREVTIAYNIRAVNAGLALAGPLANLDDVTLLTNITGATTSVMTTKLDPTLQGTSVDAYTGTGDFVLTAGFATDSPQNQLNPITAALVATASPVVFAFDETDFNIALVIKSSGAPLPITGNACTFSNEPGTCLGGANDLDECDPAAPDGSTGLADCTEADIFPPNNTPGTCEVTDGSPVSLPATFP